MAMRDDFSVKAECVNYTENEEPNQAALRNSLILERVIGFLPLYDIRSCRLLNSAWLNLATKETRKLQYRVNITDLDTMKSFLQVWKGDETNIRGIATMPFGRFILDLTAFDTEDLLDSFCQTVAPVVHALLLLVDLKKPCFSYDADLLKRLDFPTMIEFKLVVNGEKQEKEEPEASDPVNLSRYQEFISVFLEKTPKLEKLSFYGESSASLNKEAFAWMIESLGKRRSLQKLKYLASYSSGMESSHFSKLAELGLGLEIVRLYCPKQNWSMQDNSLVEFLKTQGGSLKELEVMGLTGIFDQFGFPMLPRLKNLTVYTWEPTSPDTIVVPLKNFARYFPSLRNIKLSDFTDTRDNWIQFLPESSGEPMLHVESLKLPQYLRRNDHLLHAVQCFPNIRTLRIPAQISSFNIVSKDLPNLQELILDTSLPPCVDSLVTGFTKSECEKIGEFTEKMMKRLIVLYSGNDEEEQSKDYLKQKPISSLRGLKVLRFDTQFYPDKVELTTLSSRLVLSRMESLQQIDFGRRSTEAIGKLAPVIVDLQGAGKTVTYELTDFESDAEGDAEGDAQQ